MLTLSGQLINVVPTENTNRNTGEVTKSYVAEILHKSRERHAVESVKLDAEALSSWTSAIGKHISCEVRMYAIKGSDGSVQSGLTLADKKCLPIVHGNSKPAAVAPGTVPA